ncbi:serine/threonine-protein kinase [Nocardioides sp. C4-1]|uniref:serine/threonine-protein kinase n=1 Tax=Nocardioides sp. C4-1 TaxID=3151851 RepID=UPI0032633744
MGEVFAGRYELFDPVATGGMGTIWRVHDRHDGEVKAAKILRQSDAASLLRFVREQSMRIDHTHVVTPMSWAGMDDRVLFTMPLVRGGSVADLLRERGALPVRWVVELTDQLLRALEAVHAAGIVHRDVKPGNLLLEPTGTGRPHLRLTDFGIAAPVDEPRMTRGSEAIGTPGYMPPEQWHGADPDPRADVYAVGRVALAMLLGRQPGDEDLAALRTDDPARGLLLDVVAEATRAAPADRPADATALRQRLTASGLLSLPPVPGEPGVSVPDRFTAIEAPTVADLPATTGPAPRTVAFAPGAAAPRAEVAWSRPSAVPGVVLVALGVLGLVVAAWLLVG